MIAVAVAGWVPYWDDSFDQAADLDAMYKAGYRVMAGYVAGGSSGKWSSKSRIAAWLAKGPDTGFLPLFEAAGTEPVNHPDLGDDHAKAARAGARARGIPDSVAISPAVDLNVTMAQEKADLLPYFRAWVAADSCKPIAYVEEDAGDALHQQGVSAGTFTPAAFKWNDNPVLFTPANAPAHVLVTQEHNGRQMAGGTVDIGHIRKSAPVWWKTQPNPEVPDVELTDKTPAGHTVGQALDAIFALPTSIAHGAAQFDPDASGRYTHTLSGKLDAINGLASQAAAGSTPTGAISLSDADKAEIANRVADLLAARLAS